MIHRTCTAFLIIIASAVSRGSAQNPAPPHDPDTGLLVTSDIANFWRAYDRAAQAHDGAERAQAYYDLYIRPGSPGLNNWVNARLMSGWGMVDVLIAKGWSAERLQRISQEPFTDAEKARVAHDTAGLGKRMAGWNLAAAVQRRPKFFAAIRANTLAIDTARAVKDSIHAYYRRLAALYPDAVFPPVYFLIGQLTSGGTTGPSGQLIGAELHGANDTTPLDELNAWEQRVMGRVDGLPGIVAHELMHTQQSHERHGANAAESGQTLLAQSLDEGCANFLAWMVEGADPNQAADEYGIAHEHDLWIEFQRDMNGRDVNHWLYQGDRSKDRPADLGYFMGARICGAYYRNATDKRGAVRDIFAMPNAAAFLARSGYAP